MRSHRTSKNETRARGSIAMRPFSPPASPRDSVTSVGALPAARDSVHRPRPHHIEEPLLHELRVAPRAPRIHVPQVLLYGPLVPSAIECGGGERVLRALVEADLDAGLPRGLAPQLAQRPVRPAPSRLFSILGREPCGGTQAPAPEAGGPVGGSPPRALVQSRIEPSPGGFDGSEKGATSPRADGATQSALFPAPLSPPR